MKKTLWLALAVTLLLALLMTTAQAAENRYGVVYNAAQVNLRQQPTQDSTWLGAYTSGKWVTITGESGNWYYVTGPDGKTGYMSKSFIKVESVRYGSVGIVSNPKESSYLNLRAQPSYNARVIDTFYNGVPCVLLNSSGGWYNVRVDGVEGYFRQEYITRHNYPYSDEVATIVTPNNTGLNLRTGPGMTYTSMGQYRGGKYVMVLQKGDGWGKVSVDGKVGFMSTDFLQDGIKDPVGGSSGGGQVSSGYVVVNNPKPTQVLNFRAQANTTSRILGQYRNGARLVLLARGTEWCRVRNDEGVEGYMMTEFLTVGGSGIPTMEVNHPQRTFVNLRAKPSLLTGAVLTRIPHGEEVTVLAPASNGWVKVYYNGHTGYAVDYFLE